VNGDGSAAWSRDAVKRALLLVVEDDPEMRGVLSLALQGQGFDVREAISGSEALRLIHNRTPDAAILDLGLPDMDGLDLIAKIRTEHELPIIVLSARTDEQAQVRALDGGANDFVTKPFRERELLARVRVALRKPLPFGPAAGSIALGDLRIESATRRVFVASLEVKLTRTEFELLDTLARKAEHVVTHGQLLRAVWGADHVHEIHYLRVYVKLLRQKLEVDPTKPKRLLTALGVGYRLVAATR
jgi:two-component system, OmpR family, KDP operon response regulator KdpE